MVATLVHRPVVRSFDARFTREAAAHVRAGGHAVVWRSPRRATLVVPRPKEGDEEDLGFWSILDLGKWSYDVPRSGAFRGMASLPVPRDCIDIVRRRAERDSILPGPKHAVRLDCLACGACCVANEVVLEKKDVARFIRAGRAELTKPPYARRKDGKTVLVLQKNKRCKHLGRDNKCAIYALRPDACSTFPAGSECCLYSREEELGIIDGLAERG
jgi:hypothetical protein